VEDLGNNLTTEELDEATPEIFVGDETQDGNHIPFWENLGLAWSWLSAVNIA